jgi:hypothetical protein
MRTRHAQLRAQQRGIRPEIETLLHTHGEKRHAPNGCILKFFSKNSLNQIKAQFGTSFLAKHHEGLRSYLIESKNDGSIVTLGKLYGNQRVSKSKVNKLRQ